MKYIKSINKFRIKGLLEIELDPFCDERGEIWSLHETCNIFPTFVEDKVTISKKNVLRGLHGDNETDKLICCLSGEILLSVVDYRKGSSTFGAFECFKLSSKAPKIIFVPAGCLNGHLCLSEECVFFYKWSKKYDGPENQFTIKWNDPTINIPWPIENPILSKRDQEGNLL
jgi:dTDP-4-dehydrorhamnose 3,5-epimerase